MTTPEETEVEQNSIREEDIPSNMSQEDINELFDEGEAPQILSSEPEGEETPEEAPESEENTDEGSSEPDVESQPENSPTETDLLARKADAAIAERNEAKKRAKALQERLEELEQAQADREAAELAAIEETETTVERTARLAEETAERLRAQEEREADRVEAQAFVNKGIQILERKHEAEEAFRAVNPDYDEVLEQARETFITNAMASQGLSKQEAKQLILKQELEATITMVDQGLDPVQDVYNALKPNYVPSASEETVEASSDPAPETPPAERVTRQTKSLRTTASAPPGTKTDNDETLWEDNPKEFNDLAKDPEAWKRYIEGAR